MSTDSADLASPDPGPSHRPQRRDRNWAGWYAQGDDYLFEQTSYDLRSPALLGLAGLAASLAVVGWLLWDGPPGGAVANALYGGLLVISVVALIGCAVAARALVQPVHRTARFSWKEKSLVVRDELALGFVRTRTIALPQVVQARLRSERALAAPQEGSAERDHLVAYPVSQVELELRREPAFTLTTGALLSNVAARRCVDNINEYLRKRPPEPAPAKPVAPAEAASRIRPLPAAPKIEMPAGWNAHRPRSRR
jgi:hypothetical protein